ELGAKRLDDRRQRRGEIFVLAHAEPVALHLDAAAEPRIISIERRKARTLVGRQQRWQRREPLRVERAADRRPVERRDRRMHPHFRLRSASAVSSAFLRCWPHRYPLGLPSEETAR